MNFLYIEFVLEVSTAGILWGYLWKSRDRKVMSITPREELRRHFTHWTWLVMYAETHVSESLIDRAIRVLSER
jgi:methane/ammonia monooxygenase subunit C